MYQLYFTKQARKDASLIGKSNLKNTVQVLLSLISSDPYGYPPAFELLKGSLDRAISRRINKQHRLVYQVFEEEKAIKIIMMWTHYES